MNTSLIRACLAAVALLSVATAAVSAVEIGRNDHFLVVLPDAADTLATLAQQYLGDPREGWRLSAANDGATPGLDRPFVVPLRPLNPGGIGPTTIQSVPVLCYHRFGTPSSRLTVTPAQFRAQLAYLRDHGYRVVHLEEALAFLTGDGTLPPRSVVITIDDGYPSTYSVAFPLLREFDFPATVFVYSDFVGRGGLKPAQMTEMAATGLIRFAPHSKTHANLSQLMPGESTTDYRQRLADEVGEPAQRLAALIDAPVSAFAYPYGATTGEVVDLLRDSGYASAFTVRRGANPFFAHPYLLQRSMIYGEHGLDDFAENLVVEQSYR
ncbi:MAG: polysaccharide deacetylase family protein [Pseudomonadota bacterium]